MKTSQISERHACRLLGQSRGTQRYEGIRPVDEDELTQDIIELASEYRRYGCRRYPWSELRVTTFAAHSKRQAGSLVVRAAQPHGWDLTAQPLLVKIHRLGISRPTGCCAPLNRPNGSKNKKTYGGKRAHLRLSIPSTPDRLTPSRSPVQMVTSR
jgi:hypothetical protein